MDVCVAEGGSSGISLLKIWFVEEILLKDRQVKSRLDDKRGASHWKISFNVPLKLRFCFLIYLLNETGLKYFDTKLQVVVNVILEYYFRILELLTPRTNEELFANITMKRNYVVAFYELIYSEYSRLRIQSHKEVWWGIM